MTVLQERTMVPEVEQHSDFATILWAKEENYTPRANGARILSAPSTRLVTQDVIPPLSPKAIEVILRLLSFESLNENWDGNDATPPSNELIWLAINTIVSTSIGNLPLYFTAPGPNGEILIEFKLGNRTAEIYFEDNDFAELVLYKGANQSYVGEFKPMLLASHFDMKS